MCGTRRLPTSSARSGRTSLAVPVSVLIVEDEPAILELVAVNLEHAGFAAWRAASAAGVLREDKEIDSEFRSVLRLLITYMMEDPRTITPALDIIWVAKAVERIGDHSKNIAEQVIYIVKGTDVRHTSFADIEREIGKG